MRALALALLLAPAAAAQPWSEVVPAVGVAVPLADGFEEVWGTGPAAVVRADAPAYGGRVHGAVRARRYPGDAEARTPRFDLVLALAGWGPTLARGPARLSAGPSVGAAVFRIALPRGDESILETEVAVGAWAHGAVRVGPVEVWAQADAARLALREPTVLTSLTAGVAVPLRSPGWLAEALR